VLVFNDTRVLNARFRGVKASGGQVEVLVERVMDVKTVLAQVRASKSPKPGMRLRLADAFEVEVGERAGEFFVLHFPTDALTLIEQFGSLPLPPYITHKPDEIDAQRYQTVYADPGAVRAAAAPTAGLHFTPELLATLRARGHDAFDLVLDVGPGTFQPIQVDDLSAHVMHAEAYRIPAPTLAALRDRRPRLAVGTTSVRAAEDALRKLGGFERAPGGDFVGSASLFIQPGDTIGCCEHLLTNFHLPRSTLLCLVGAFLTPGSPEGLPWLKEIYAEAIRREYRFFSYGDAMLVL
jgi:S-adenosylmethionine:tRNA ribosyltransferase-isomerase